MRFEREPGDMVLTEMTRTAGSYVQTPTLLHLPPTGRIWREREDEGEGGWEPGKRMGPPPVRNLNRSG